MAQNEQQLINEILGGRTEAFGQLVSRYGGALTGFVASFVSHRADVDEVVQQSFVAAFEHLRRYDARRASFQTWLWRIAHHAALKHLKSQKRFTLFSDFAPGSAASPSGIVSPRPGSALGGFPTEPSTADVPSRRLKLLEAAIDSLPPTDQLLLNLYYTEERPLTDIAYILDTNANALGSRLYRIRQRLAQTIKRLEYETD
ncbi:MAG: sigma-70 family RNA polymerase sigma factor [Bacteroidaceae bacterium]|nr:sigma-70 family RNA polymerase sigma factor [Bacteroidaceae bacterium]